MSEIPQSRVVAQLGHKDKVAFARPFHDGSQMIAVRLNRAVSVSKLNRELPGDWRVSCVSAGAGKDLSINR